MKTLFEQEIERLNQLIGRQAAAAENAVRQSLKAIVEKNRELAIAVVEQDDIIDLDEVRLEEECLKALALYQPVAGDLRYIITLLKVNGELERIGDLAVNIAQRALDLCALPDAGLPTDFEELLTQVRQSLKRALDSLLTHDCFLASQVIEADNIIDQLHRENVVRMIQWIKEKPQNVDNWIDFLSVSRNLERIGDSCTNIGEDVLYLQQGRIMRHLRESDR